VIKTRLAALAAIAVLAFGASTTTWETSSASDFLKGRLRGLSLTSEGWLRPGPALRRETPLNEPVLWSLIPAGEGGVYASTGHTGKVFHIDRNGKSTLLWKADQPEVFALCTDSKGRLYAGTSPNGGIYRIDGGTATEVAQLGVKYIWAIVPGADDSLFVATGDRGRIFRVNAKGQTELYFETGQNNITALALGFGGHLYAGSEPNGLLYDITGPKQGSVVFRSNLPEIHAIAVRKDGTIFASALGGSLTSRVSPAAGTAAAGAGGVVASSPTVITVSEAREGATPEQSADVKVQPRPPAQPAAPPAQPATPSYTEVAGAEKSAVYRIQPDGPIDTLRTSKEENVYDLILNGDAGVYVSTDVRGRLYSVEQSRKQTLLTEAGDGDANQVVNGPAGVWVGMSNPARVVLISNTDEPNASYESPVHDTTTLARWGHLSWNATGPGIQFRTRSGNSFRPDDTWSKWSDPITKPEQSAIQSPRGRYIQWRAEWREGSTADLQGVTVPFLPQNTAPVVRSISVSSIAQNTQAQKPPSGNPAQGGAYTITVTDTGDASSSTSGTVTQTPGRQNASQTQLTWQADDPDGDKLVYSIFFRGEDERDWKLLRRDVPENTVLLDADVLADGRYLFRVVASDRPGNDLRYAQQAELVSSPVLIDGTPPAVTAAVAQRNGGKVKLAFTAEDQVTSLRRCEYSVDAGQWQPLEAADGITDGKSERFELELADLKPGEHVVAVRVYDSAGNAGVAKVVVH
jgi:hypothetical protein